MGILDFIRERARYYNCPACGHSLRGCELRMLRHVQDRYTVQVTCASCGVQFVVILAVQGEGLSAEEEAEAIAELAEFEEGAEEEAEVVQPIALDEVLDVHLALRDFQGSLTDLIAALEERR
jgi:transcription elongation factor Elf1